MVGIPSFIFGAGTKYKTQEELDRAREQVKALLGDIGESKFEGWGGVLADLGKGISARVEKGRIGEGQEFLTGEQSKLWDMFGGGGDGGDIATAGGTDTAAGSVGADPVNRAFTSPPPSNSSAQDAVFQNSGGSGGDYLRYANKGATRNKPLAPKLEQALGFLSDLGVTAEVFSGGQDASGPNRTGSHRHDHGNAGDIRFYKDGRQLSWANKADLPIFQEIVRRGKAAGITGFGAGPGYMGEGTMHVGFGTPSVWGAGGRSRNAPGWLTDAYSGQLGGGGGTNDIAGGGAADVALQPAPFDLHNRFRITPAMLGPDEEPVPAPLPAPAPVPARNVPINDAGLRTPAGQDFLSRMGSPAPMANQQLPMVSANPQRRMVNPASMSGGAQPLPMVPGRSGGPMPSLQQPVPPPQPPQPVPPPPPAPAPAPPAPPPAPPRPQVDPFTDMILGDKAAQFKPGNYIPPAPVGQQAFPAAPPAPGTPAAAGFGVPPVVGGGGADQLAGKGTFPPAPPPPQAQQRGGSPQNVIGKLMTILASPYASDEQKRMATAMLSREYALEDERRKAAAEAADPLNKLKLEQAQLEVDKLKRGDTPALMNAGGGNIYNPATGEWIQAPAGPGGGGPFSGESVEAQALNGMVANGTLTVQQAYDLAAGKTITDPSTGAIIFMTPNGLVGGPPGQPPQPIPTPAPAQAGTPAPAQTPPPQGTPAPAPAGTPAAPAGGRAITGGKPGKMATEAETRARALYAVASPEMKTVEQMFPALGDIDNQMYSQMPWNTGNWATSEDYQRGKNALMTIIQSYMYVTSGASAPDAEVERNANSLMPQPGEKPGTVKDKLARIQNYVRAIKMAGGQGEEAAAGGGRLKFNPATGELE